jgi:hypothetical protein
MKVNMVDKNHEQTEPMSQLQFAARLTLLLLQHNLRREFHSGRGKKSMSIHHVHTFVVHPRKGTSHALAVNGTAIALSGKMFDLLQNIYTKSEQECDVGITFAPTTDGKQQNDCRNLICGYLSDSSLSNGRAIAERLEKQTDGRSGIGLLFLISGKEEHDHKIVISRFPTDNAIYVEEDKSKLSVEFLERVFMKNKASYKAVVYRDSSLNAGFWNGRAIDKQLNNPLGEVSNYWIQDFLSSRLTVTAAAGTRRLAIAMLAAIKKSDLKIKQEIIAAATLAPGLNNQRLNIDEFGQRFSISANASSAISSELKAPVLALERFQFDSGEFQSLFAFKSVELDNGGTLTAPSSNFDSVFSVAQVAGTQRRVRFTTEGEIIDERLKPKA